MNEPRLGLTPDAQDRLRAARGFVQTRLDIWGPLNVAHGIVVILVFLGAAFPVATIAQYGFFTTTTSGVHFYNLGLGGWFLIVAGLLLAAAPFAITLTPRSACAAFGLACVGVGMLVVPYVLSTYTGALAQLAFGYFALILGYLILAGAYWIRSSPVSHTEQTVQPTESHHVVV